MLNKIVDSVLLDLALTSTANAIRSKTGGTISLSWNASTGFADAVNSITSAKNQTKTGIAPTETAQTISFDTGYTGLNSVQINAISPTYVGSSVLRKAAQTYTPTTTNQTIASGQYLTGTQTIAGSANLVAGNIKSGVTLFGVTGICNFSKVSEVVTIQNEPFTIYSIPSGAIVSYVYTMTFPSDTCYLYTPGDLNFNNTCQELCMYGSRKASFFYACRFGEKTSSTIKFIVFVRNSGRTTSDCTVPKGGGPRCELIIIKNQQI